MHLSSFAAFGVILAVLVSGMVLHSVYTFMFRWNINATLFMGQIQKLVMANNIDRSIKLCNAEPNALLPRAVKALLCRANRPYSLFLTQEEALLELRTVTGSMRAFGVGGLLFGLLVLGVLSAGMMNTLEGLSLEVYQWSAVVTASMLFLGWWNQMWVVRHMITIEASVVKTRNILYARGNYKPPQYEPIKMTGEEIARWRQSMDYVEGEAVKAGAGTAADLHDSMANKNTGVLPPL